MKAIPFRLALVLLASTTAAAQEPVYQTQEQYSVKLKLDGLVRKEWTRDVFVAAGQVRNEDRWRGRALPRLEITAKKLLVGVGGDFNYSSDENTEPPPALLRDNYKSRDARLDLAFASLKPAAWIEIQGGRFAMPVGLTEMIWDRDLRPQGGAMTLEAKDLGSVKRLGATAVLAKGSHVFADDKTQMLLLSGEAAFALSAESKLTLTASFVQFRRLDSLEPMIRRQNTRVAGVAAPAPLALEYEVADVVARYKHEGRLATQLVADYCWNTAADRDNRGLWLAIVVGSTQTARGRLEYTYAKVDKDATVAAYATDDFFWATGWEGHRGDVGLKASDRTAFHAVGQLQRFKDSPRAEERDHWVKRARLELRVSY